MLAGATGATGPAGDTGARGLQVLPVLQEPREHKVLQALPDLPDQRDPLAPRTHRTTGLLVLPDRLAPGPQEPPALRGARRYRPPVYGATGVTGATGATGEAQTITIRNTTTSEPLLPPASQIYNWRSQPCAGFHHSTWSHHRRAPRAETGATGAAGPAGATGATGAAGPAGPLALLVPLALPDLLKNWRLPAPPVLSAPPALQGLPVTRVVKDLPDQLAPQATGAAGATGDTGERGPLALPELPAI